MISKYNAKECDNKLANIWVLKSLAKETKPTSYSNKTNNTISKSNETNIASNSNKTNTSDSNETNTSDLNETNIASDSNKTNTSDLNKTNITTSKPNTMITESKAKQLIIDNDLLNLFNHTTALSFNGII